MQEDRTTLPYPLKWDSVWYPSTFKMSTLNSFDERGLPNLNISYFKFQIRSVITSDYIYTLLFVATLKGVTFEWFLMLLQGSIKS